MTEVDSFWSAWSSFPEIASEGLLLCTPYPGGVEAAERLNRIKIVKSDKAERLENMILQMAQQGQVQSQITDSYLKQMLEGISEGGVRLIACAALLTHACTRIALSACAFLPVR